VFQNTVLTEHAVRFLREKGFQVYMNLSVPPNDGGISLGQVYLGRKYLETFHQTK
jgi:hydrogenase maturation protein HypF